MACPYNQSPSPGQEPTQEELAICTLDCGFYLSLDKGIGRCVHDIGGGITEPSRGIVPLLGFPCKYRLTPKQIQTLFEKTQQPQNLYTNTDVQSLRIVQAQSPPKLTPGQRQTRTLAQVEKLNRCPPGGRWER